MTNQAAQIIEKYIKDLSNKCLFISEPKTDDIPASFQEARRILTQIIQALAAVLDKKEYLYLFEDNGPIYSKAKVLGELRRAQGFDFEQVIQEYLVLRKEVWALMRGNLPQEDIDMFEVEERINFCLTNVLKATIETYHNRQTKDLNKLAITDCLTSLFNRRQFDMIIDQEVYRADRYERPLSLAILDIDFFKMFNDMHGHQAGDMALKKVSSVIRQFLRTSDTAARYGGEEFAIVLPETAEEDAYKVCDRIRRAVERYRFPISKTKNQLTVSIGLATYPKNADNIESLVKAADNSLYKAKFSGRNKVVAFSNIGDKSSSRWLTGIRTK